MRSEPMVIQAVRLAFFGALIAGIGAHGTVLLSASLVGLIGIVLATRPAIHSV